MVKHGHAYKGAVTPTYRSWMNMNYRCKATSSKAKYYFERGITVCERWSSFDKFLADMGERPDGLTLDRYPNKDGNYEPGNCRWANQKQQTINRRITVNVTLNGITKCVSEWADELGIQPKTILKRVHAGWPPEKALSTKMFHDRKGPQHNRPNL